MGCAVVGVVGAWVAVAAWWLVAGACCGCAAVCWPGVSPWAVFEVEASEAAVAVVVAAVVTTCGCWPAGAVALVVGAG